MLGFTKFNQNRWSHFWENKNFNFFFSCELPFILVVGGKLKTARDIYMRTLYIKFERDRSIGLGSTFGDGLTHTRTHARTHARTNAHTHAHTHTYTHIFFLKLFLDSGSDVEWKIIKKSKSKILTIAILPSLLMSLESKKKVLMIYVKVLLYSYGRSSSIIFMLEIGNVISMNCPKMI